MALFALSDLHLSLGIDKPMDIFGPLWHGYMDRIRENWQSLVSDNDLVIIGGDVSWATYLREVYADFEFLHSLSGKKLIVKGNHDYWWESMAKLDNFLSSNGFGDVSFLNNSAYVYEDFLISGTRLWKLPDADGFNDDDRKIYERELIRFKLSLDEAERLKKTLTQREYTKIAVFHHPPFLSDGGIDGKILELLKDNGIKKCIYGHLHGKRAENAKTGRIDGIDFYLSSADYLGFKPLEISN